MGAVWCVVTPPDGSRIIESWDEKNAGDAADSRMPALATHPNQVLWMYDQQFEFWSYFELKPDLIHSRRGVDKQKLPKVLKLGAMLAC